MNLQDAMFNWLQIRLVSEARPEDRAAKETLDFFEQILREDHGLSSVTVAASDSTMVHVRYAVDGKTKLQMFDRERAEQLLTDIESDPRYLH